MKILQVQEDQRHRLRSFEYLHNHQSGRRGSLLAGWPWADPTQTIDVMVGEITKH